MFSRAWLFALCRDCRCYIPDFLHCDFVPRLSISEITIWRRAFCCRLRQMILPPQVAVARRRRTSSPSSSQTLTLGAHTHTLTLLCVCRMMHFPKRGFAGNCEEEEDEKGATADGCLDRGHVGWDPSIFTLWNLLPHHHRRCICARKTRNDGSHANWPPSHRVLRVLCV